MQGPDHHPVIVRLLKLILSTNWLEGIRVYYSLISGNRFVAYKEFFMFHQIFGNENLAPDKIFSITLKETISNSMWVVYLVVTCLLLLLKIIDILSELF